MYYIMNMARLILVILVACFCVSSAPLATNPVDFAVFEQNNVQVKRYPIDSLIPDTVENADTSEFAHVADTALNTPDSVRTSSKSDRADSARATWKSDTTAGSARFGGWTKDHSDSMTFCDTPWIPLSKNITGLRRYDTSAIKQIVVYDTIVSESESLIVVLDPPGSNNFSGMAADTSGNVYAIGNNLFFVQSSGCDSFRAVSVTNRSYRGIYHDKVSNDLFAGVGRTGGWSIYRMVDCSGDFILYFDTSTSTTTYPKAVSVSESGDVYVATYQTANFGGYILRQTAGSGGFNSISTLKNWSGLTCIGDTLYASANEDNNDGIYVMLPGGALTSIGFSKNPHYNGLWSGGGYIYYVGLTENNDQNIYRFLNGSTTSDSIFKWANNYIPGGAVSGNRLYACDLLRVRSNHPCSTFSVRTIRVAERLSVGDVPTDTNPATVKYLLVKNAEPDNEVKKISLDSLTSIAKASDYKLLQSTPAGRIDTTHIKTASSFTEQSIELGDSGSPAKHQIIRRGATATDQDRDSSLLIFEGGGSNDKARGGTITTGGNESSIRGGITLSPGDTAGILNLAEFTQFSKTGHADSPGVWIIDESRALGFPKMSLYCKSPLYIKYYFHSAYIKLDSNVVWTGDSLRFQRALGAGPLKVGTLTRQTTMDSLGIYGNKFKITPEGGYAIRMINRTGAESVKGYIVHPSPSYDTACTLAIVNVPDVIGVVYEDGVADGSEMWVVVDGYADVYFIGNATRGHIARGFITGDAGYVAGQALSEAVPTAPFATDKHFYEIGHVVQSRTGAGLARCVLHFN